MSNSEFKSNDPTAQPQWAHASEPLSVPGLFFAGTDTEVGKTHQASSLVRQLCQRKVRTGVYKPVLSGLAAATGMEDGSSSDDASILCQAAGLDKTMIGNISPQRFAAPLAPPLAARREGRSVDEELLYSGALWWVNQCDFLVVEGAGGLMSPVSDRLTVVDLARQLGLPVVLVAANRLGCISHILLAVEALQRRSIELFAILMNRLPSADDWSDQTAHGNIDLLSNWLPNVAVVEQASQLLELQKSQGFWDI